MFQERLLAGLRPALEGVRVQMRLPWYRSLQLSCIEQLDLEIDGEKQPAARLQVVINGNAHPLTEVSRLHESWWFVLDAIDLQVATALTPGDHLIRLTLQLRIPYGDPDFRPELNIRQAVTCAKELTLPGWDD